MELRARAVIDGTAEGCVLRLDEPLSFWGGVDPASGRLSDPRSPRCGTPVNGRVLVLAETRGSSSSSAVMLELLARNLAPAALVLGRIDAILGLGIIVAREMGHPTVPLLLLPPEQQRQLADGLAVRIERNGRIIGAPTVAAAGPDPAGSGQGASGPAARRQ